MSTARSAPVNSHAAICDAICSNAQHPIRAACTEPQVSCAGHASAIYQFVVSLGNRYPIYVLNFSRTTCELFIGQLQRSAERINGYVIFAKDDGPI